MNSSSIFLVSVGVSPRSDSPDDLIGSAWAAMAPPYPGEEGVKPPRGPADVDRVTARALSLLAAFASPVFMAVAIAGWLSGHLPATPLTLGIAAFLVIGGPALGIVHVATSRDADEDFEDETIVIEELRPSRWRSTASPLLPSS